MNKGADPMSYDNSGHHYSDCTVPAAVIVMNVVTVTVAVAAEEAATQAVSG